MSSTEVMSVASDSRSSRWHPTDAALVTGPGTAPSGRPRVNVWAAVFAAPERRPASTTTVAEARALMILLRCRKRQRVGACPTGSSETSAPSAMMRSRRDRLPCG